MSDGIKYAGCTVTGARQWLFPRSMRSWIDTANLQPTLIDRMRALLRGDDWISFAEFDQLDGFRGNQPLMAGDGLDNLVLWPSISAQGAIDLAALIARGECHIAGASVFTYIADGRLPRLPIARRRRAYSSPHWLPVVLCRGAAVPRENRARRVQHQPAPRKRHLIPGKLRAHR